MTETMIEPMHPSPLEKKTNTPPRYPVPPNRYAGPSSSVGSPMAIRVLRLAHPLVHAPRREREHGDRKAAEYRGLDAL